MEKNVLAEGRSPIADVDLTSSADASKVLGRFVGSRNSVGLVGFEPTASASRTQRSTKLSHSPWQEQAKELPRGEGKARRHEAAFEGKTGITSAYNFHTDPCTSDPLPHIPELPCPRS